MVLLPSSHQLPTSEVLRCRGYCAPIPPQFTSFTLLVTTAVHTPTTSSSCLSAISGFFNLHNDWHGQRVPITPSLDYSDSLLGGLLIFNVSSILRSSTNICYNNRPMSISPPTPFSPLLENLQVSVPNHPNRCKDQNGDVTWSHQVGTGTWMQICH